MEERRLALTAGLAGAFMASLCCAGPLILALFGVLSIPAAGVLAESVFAHFWWAFVSVGLGVSFTAVLWYTHQDRSCPAEEAIRLRRTRRNAIALALAVFVVGYLAWDFLIVEWIGVHVGAWSNPLLHQRTSP